MGRSKFPGKPSRLASKKRVSVLVATCLPSSPSSSSVSCSSSIAVSPSRGKSSPLSNGYNEDTTISSSGDLIKKCSGSSVDEAAPAGSVVQASNSNSDSISNNHSNHVATSCVIKVQSPCNNNNSNTSTSDHQDEEEGGGGSGGVAATGGEIIAIVSSHNFHGGDKTQVRQPYLYLSIHSNNNCGGDDDE